jgi:hypothetical protein
LKEFIINIEQTAGRPWNLNIHDFPPTCIFVLIAIFFIPVVLFMHSRKNWLLPHGETCPHLKRKAAVLPTETSFCDIQMKSVAVRHVTTCTNEAASFS